MRHRDSNPTQVETGSSPVSVEDGHAALSDIGQLLLRQLDPPILYQAVIDVLERRVGALRVIVGEVDRAGQCVQRVAPSPVAPGMADIYPERVPLSIARAPFWRGEPQVEADLFEVPELAPFRAAYRRYGVSAAVAVPVLKFGEVRAALVIRARDAGFFSPPMIELLKQAAASIGLGLEAYEQRWRLTQAMHDEARQRRALRLLSEMIKVVTHSGNEQALLSGACRVAQDVGGYPLALIGLREGDAGRRIRLCASAGRAQVLGHDFAIELADPARAENAAVVALLTGQPCVRQREPPACVEDPCDVVLAQARSVLALPLLGDGTPVGVFVVAGDEADAFTAVEVQVFSEVAIELGLGIQIHRAHAARLAAEKDLRFNLQYFRAVLSHQYAGIALISADGRVKFSNKAFGALFGLSETPDELEGRPFSFVCSLTEQAYEHPEQEQRRLREIIDRGVAVSGEEIGMKGGRTFLRDFTPIVIDGTAQGWIWHQRDITEQKMYEAKVERLAFYDVVTGLPNRRLLFQLLEQARSQATRRRSLLAVGVLDLDRFKSVNDTVGHDGGDRVLAEASERVLGILREDDVLARFGGDEFALVIPGLDSKEQLDVISRCILQALRAPFDLSGEQAHLSASIGWTLFPLDKSGAEGLIRHADLAMYAAKDEGKDRGALYEPAMELEQLRLQAMRDRMAQALLQSRLLLLFQPIVFIDGLPGLHGVAGMEALLRLQDPELGLIEPVDFMHVLDDPQLARPIGRYVLDESLKQCEAWMQAGVSIPVSVNVSTRHLLHPGFFSDIDAVLETYPHVMDVGFGIEVTETGPSMDHARAKVVIEECRRRGIRVGLDDFGTGSASLSHIQQLDIEHIKLDQSFVRDILSDDRNMAIAAGVITTARMLAKTVIAEGVETAEQGDLLASLGCHQLQGFSISRPMPAEAVPAWVAGWVPPASWERLAGERQSRLAGRPGTA